MKPQKLPEQSPHSARKALNRHLDRIYPFDLGQFVSGIFTREAHFPEIFNNYHPLVVTIDQKCFWSWLVSLRCIWVYPSNSLPLVNGTRKQFRFISRGSLAIPQEIPWNHWLLFLHPVSTAHVESWKLLLVKKSSNLPPPQKKIHFRLRRSLFCFRGCGNCMWLGVDAMSGQRLWQLQLPGVVFASPCVDTEAEVMPLAMTKPRKSKNANFAPSNGKFHKKSGLPKVAFYCSYYWWKKSCIPAGMYKTL